MTGVRVSGETTRAHTFWAADGRYAADVPEAETRLILQRAQADEEPKLVIEIDGERFTAIAHVADGAERRRLYDQHAAINPSFLEYEERTTRVIPVVVLERVKS